MLQDLQLLDKTKTAAKNLSGGMKRKLRYNVCSQPGSGSTFSQPKFSFTWFLVACFFQHFFNVRISDHAYITNRSFVM